MDENQKKPTRDISDLKARLGLKKGPTGQQPVAPLGGGQLPSVLHPGDLGGGGPAAAPPPVVPPPIRASEPEPVPAVDPRRDPFGTAQPAPSSHGYYAPPPDYYAPPPGDASSVDAAPISKPKPWNKIGLGAGVAIVLFLFGYGVGRIYESRHNFNKTTDEAGEIRDEVDKMQKELNAVSDLIVANPNAQKNIPDVELAAKLGGLGLKKPDTQKIFHTNYMYLEDLAIETLFTYYNDTILLYGLIADHAKKTDGDKEAIEGFIKSETEKQKAGGAKNYGVVLDTSGKIALANFVELGAPVCATPPAEGAECSDVKAFKYRTNPGGQWFEKTIKGKVTDVVVPIQPSELFKGVSSGSPEMLAFRDAQRRQGLIRALLAKLGNESKDLTTKLKAAAERQKVFTF